MSESEPPRELLDALDDPDTRVSLQTADAEPSAGLDADGEARLRAWLRLRVAGLPAERRRRQWRRLSTRTAAVAAAAAGVALFLRPGVEPTPQPSASNETTWQVQLGQGAALTWVDPDGHSHRLHRAAAVRAPDRMETDPDSSAELTTPDGVRLHLSPGTRVKTPTRRAGDARAEVALEHGWIDVSVPYLGAHRSFAVRTPDREVIVHGTRFRVRVLETRTCVRVSEGKVEVRERNPKGASANSTPARFLGPGESVGCEGAAPPRPAAPRRTPRRVTRSSARRPNGLNRIGAPEPPRPEPPPPGTLAEQNRLLSRALAAERKGQLDAARQAFRELLQQYPDSPLVPDARRGLGRIQPRDATPTQ